MTIFDASHPREKPCGGGVTGRAFSLVRGTLSGFTVGATPITSARFTIARRDRQAVVPLDGGALAVADRATFDAALLDAAIAAGATLVTSRVVDVSASPAISASHARSDLVLPTASVGADGANSLVRREALAHPFTRAQLSVATGWLRARRDKRRDRHRVDRRSAGLSVVVPASRSPRDRRLRPG